MKSRLASKFHIFVLLPLPLPYSFDALRSFNRALGFLHYLSSPFQLLSVYHSLKARVRAFEDQRVRATTTHS